MLLKSPLINNGGIMQMEQSEKQPVIIYGKKVYFINPLIAKKEISLQKEPNYLYEDIEDLPE